MKRLFTTALLCLLCAGLFAQETRSPASLNQMDGNTVKQDVNAALSDGQDQTLELFIPNAFTPNNDGINDFYEITANGFRSTSFAIFNRYGNKVFDSKSMDFRWNGKVGEQTAPTGVYVFVFKGVTNDGLNINRSGTISIIY